ncbi:OTU-like cysteine protease [Talaromyces proteolyticus]|uniref:OTU-like cysteine protease n=1 Tax=Talaromyces proteolyticus TaxID=1131652 RepID=A0AAD4L116_9EURO|nr:OTU-like cysteine protease [Talaromyces proteolyticus]KAH8701895.1 OTU-like cysteine protease [Talaromyces proteolyticus]
MEELQARHRKEQRELQARITQKKKNATKKTRKGVNDECDKLQQELNQKQNLEISQLNGDDVSATADSLDHLDLNDEANQQSTTESAPPASDAVPKLDLPTGEPGNRGKKPNRQKARLARREAERVAQAEIAAEEAAKQTDHRGNEKEVMDAAFSRIGLKEIEITPDGHCLYSAIACQLNDLGLGLKPDPSRIVLQPATVSRIDTVASPRHDGYRAVRAVTADYIKEHQDDFVPFMEEPLDEYVKKIRLTAEWGGQLELQAIARAYGVEINVLQGDGRIEKIEGAGDDADLEQQKRQIWLAYYRHTYGLGEHYNALVQKAA